MKVSLLIVNLLHLSIEVVGSSNDLIATDFKKATSEMGVNVVKDASLDCWLDSLNRLELQLFSNDEAHDGTNINIDGVTLSPGGNFCAYMRSGSGTHLDVLAFELTKCEYEKFNEPLPIECGANNETSMRNCISSLSTGSWLAIWTAFTQYKLSAYNICTKLTDELMLYRQKEAAYHFEKTIGKMDEVLQNADTQIEGTINLIRVNVEDMKHGMKEDVKGMINEEMKNVQQLHEEMKSTLNKVDDKLEETSRKLEGNVQNALTEFYQTSGLKRFIDLTGSLNSGSFIFSSNKLWANLMSLSRSFAVLIVTMFSSRSRRIQRARPLITFLIAFESIVELNLNYLASIGQLEVAKRNKITHSLRCCDFIIYFFIMAITFLTSFFLKRDVRHENNGGVQTDENTSTQNQQSDSSLKMMDDVLDKIRIQINLDQETRRRETEQWKQELIKNLSWNLQHERLQEERFTVQEQQQQQRRYNNCSYSTGSNYYIDTPRVVNPAPTPPRTCSNLSSSSLLLSSLLPPPSPSLVVPRSSFGRARQHLEFPSENSSNEVFEGYDTCSEGEGTGIGGNKAFISPTILNGDGSGSQARAMATRGSNDNVQVRGDKKRKAPQLNCHEEESEQNEFESAEKKQKNHH